jgi:glutamyl-tRNA synthetase
LRKSIAEKPEARSALSALAAKFATVEPWDEATVEAAIHAAEAAAGIPEGKLNQALRLALTGATIGAGIYETAVLLGRDRCIARMQGVFAAIDGAKDEG